MSNEATSSVAMDSSSANDSFSFSSFDFHETNETLINRVFHLAKEALNLGEVPVGCVLALKHSTSDTFLVLGEGKNETNATKNATRHAELVAIDGVLLWCKENGFQGKHTQIFRRLFLYVNVEPCVMCAGALAVLNLDNIIFGCRNERFGGFGSVLNVPENLNYFPTVVEGVQSEESVDLLKQFYSQINPNAPKPKGKKTVS